MNIWRHVATVSGDIHDALMRWARVLLQEAGLEEVEVYGQFPPQGTVSHHVVLFPYRVHPEPKVAENAPGLSLLGAPERVADRGAFVPPPWLALGGAITNALELVFPSVPARGTSRRPLDDVPFPLVDALPGALGAWYQARIAEPLAEPWWVQGQGGAYARPPALWWRPGLTVTTRYIAIAGEPGRGTAQRTSTSTPMSLRALSVLATGLHLERTVQVEMPPPPLPAGLDDFVLALADGLALMRAPNAVASADRLREALTGVNRVAHHTVEILPIHDLDNHEFALLMQALQRPLQPALNLCVQHPLGAAAVFSPGAGTDVRLRPASRGEPPRARPRGADEDTP